MYNWQLWLVDITKNMLRSVTWHTENTVYWVSWYIATFLLNMWQSLLNLFKIIIFLWFSKWRNRRSKYLHRIRNLQWLYYSVTNWMLFISRWYEKFWERLWPQHSLLSEWCTMDMSKYVCKQVSIFYLSPLIAFCMENSQFCILVE